MTTSNSTADLESVETSPSGDNSQTAPEEGAQSTDLASRIAELEASNTKLTGDLSRETGRVRQLRQERETSSEVSAAGFGNALRELAQSQESGNNDGLASRVEGHLAKATEASTQARMTDRQTGYSQEIAKAIEDAGMDENDPSLNEASILFSNAQTMAEKSDAVTLVVRITDAKILSDDRAKAKANAKTAEEVREETLKETNARDLMPSGAGSGGGGNNSNNISNSQVIAKGLEEAGGLEAWGNKR